LNEFNNISFVPNTKGEHFIEAINTIAFHKTDSNFKEIPVVWDDEKAKEE
jgi:hypothetical protein